MWRGDISRAFRIKSAIRIIQGTQAPSMRGSWSWVWRTKAPQRCKVFLWLALHDRLLTNVNRAKRGMTNDPLCPLCELEYEDTKHITRHCSEAQRVWAFFFGNRMGIHGNRLGFREWIEENVMGCKHQEDWPTKFITTIWYLWKWQNAACFKFGRNITIDKPYFLMGRFKEILRALNNDVCCPQSARPERRETVVRWEGPPPNWVILNTDGAPKGNPGPAGRGGVIRFTEENGSVVSLKKSATAP